MRTSGEALWQTDILAGVAPDIGATALDGCLMTPEEQFAQLDPGIQAFYNHTADGINQMYNKGEN